MEFLKFLIKSFYLNLYLNTFIGTGEMARHFEVCTDLEKDLNSCPAAHGLQ